MRAEGLSPHGWGNGPGDAYGWHEHGYEKVLYCVRGRIVFHTAGGDIELGPGDKMVLPPHTLHAATVGTEGVRCIEAPPPAGRPLSGQPFPFHGRQAGIGWIWGPRPATVTVRS
jgi:hypothetical protein